MEDNGIKLEGGNDETGWPGAQQGEGAVQTRGRESGLVAAPGSSGPSRSSRGSSRPGSQPQLRLPEGTNAASLANGISATLTPLLGVATGLGPSQAPVFRQASQSRVIPEVIPPNRVPVNPNFTTLTPLVPGEPFPSISPRDQVKVRAWMAKDLAYAAVLSKADQGQKRAWDAIATELLQREDWLGTPRAPPSECKIILEKDRLWTQSQGKRGNLRPEIKLSKVDLRRLASEREFLVPIRVEIEHDAYKLRDTFTWNLRETGITPEIFAKHLCADLRLPQAPFHAEIVQQIKHQLHESKPILQYSGYGADAQETTRKENQQWWEQHAERSLDGSFKGDPAVPGVADEDVSMAEVVHIPDQGNSDGVSLGVNLSQALSHELRITIHLDVTLDSVQLLDKFEWDISDTRNSPEEFAATFATDLGLGGEFRTAIAHSIREQIEAFVKSLQRLGHVQGRHIQDEDLRRDFLPPLSEPVRADASDYTPSLSQLNADEVDRNDKEREREVRRKRRQTKGRGVPLPDREPVKTHRTLVPKPSTIFLQPTVDALGNVQYPLPEMNMPYPISFESIPSSLGLSATSTSASPVKPSFGRSRVGSAVPQAGPSKITSSSRLQQLQTDDDTSSRASNGGSMEGLTTAGSTRTRSMTPVGGVVGADISYPGEPQTEGRALQPCMVNGVWHCANCGNPDAVGKRKGPEGTSTLCSECGKYFSQHRAIRACAYSTNPADHPVRPVKPKKIPAQGPRNPAGTAPKPRQKKASLEVPRVTESPRLLESPYSLPPEKRIRRPTPPGAIRRRKTSEPPTPRQGQDEDSDGASSYASEVPKGRRSPDPPYPGTQSPSSGSGRSPSPPPFAPTPPPPPARNEELYRQEQLASQRAAVNETARQQVQLVAQRTEQPMPWMRTAAAALAVQYPGERFEVIAKGPAWRIRCIDCPGKLYNLGPGETLENFAVHFKNRKHRANVEEHSNRR